MSRYQTQRGQTLAFVAALVIVLVGIVVFFVVNYSQLMGFHKQYTTAIEAASLAAAEDMSRIVVNTPLGRVALVDDVPAYTLPSGATTGSTDPRPILGINTLTATLRLDAVIASQLNNSSMSFMLKHDMCLLNGNGNGASDSSTVVGCLTKAINDACDSSNGIGYDKYSSKIYINPAYTAAVGTTPAQESDALQTYMNNPQTMGNTSASDPSSLNMMVTPGYITGSGAPCTTPTPTPQDSQTTGASTYTAYQNYTATVSGQQFTFQFAPISDQLALVPNNAFSANAPSGCLVPPSAVQVTATVNASSLSHKFTTSTQNGVTTTKQSSSTGGNTATAMATAVCGGAYQPAPTGTLQISFAAAGGMPASGTTKVDFTSPLSIMNSDPANATTGQNGFNTWNASNPQVVATGPLTTTTTNSTWGGMWFAAQGGPLPAANGKSGSLGASPFKGINGSGCTGGYNQTVDNPSVVLAYVTWDWLKSLGLRPNTASVVSALKVNLNTLQTSVMQNTGNLVFYDFPPGVQGAGTVTPNPMQQSTSNPNALTYNSSVMRNLSKAGVTTAMLNFNYGNTAADPRNLANYSSHPAESQDMLNTEYGYLPTAPVIPDFAQMVNVIMGTATTTDGNSIAALSDFQTAVSNMSMVANNAMIFATNTLNQSADLVLGNPQTTVGAAFINDGTTVINALSGYPQGSALASDLNAIQNGSMTAAPANVQQAIQDLQAQVAQDQQSGGGGGSSGGGSSGGGSSGGGSSGGGSSGGGSTGGSSQLTQDQSNLSTLQNAFTDMKNQIANANNTMLAEFPTLANALVNTNYATTLAGDFTPSNMAALTSIGCKEIDSGDFVIAGAGFFPATKGINNSATKSDFGSGWQPSAASTQNQNGGTVYNPLMSPDNTPATGGKGTAPKLPTGQEGNYANQDWGQAITVTGTQPNANATSNLYFYKVNVGAAQGVSPPVNISDAGQESGWFLPAEASPTSSQSTTDMLKYSFFVVGDSPGQGNIRLRAGGTSPFAGESVLQGQALYQDVQAFTVTNPTSASGTTTTICYQVQARDEAANSYASCTTTQTPTPSSTPSYFADVNAAGGNQDIPDSQWCSENRFVLFPSNSQTPQCPALVAEWQVSCPAPVTTCAGAVCFPPVVQYTPVSSITSWSYWTVSSSFGACIYMHGGTFGTIWTNYAQSTVTTTPAFWNWGGMYYYDWPVPSGTAQGNGWYLRTSPYSDSHTFPSFVTGGGENVMTSSHS